MKTLLLDIETAPTTAYVWQLWRQNVAINQIAKQMYVLNWSAKWLGEDYLYSDSLHYHPEWKKDPSNDLPIMETLWPLMNEADLIVGHNLDRFDIPTVNSRFLIHGMESPSTFKTYDTFKAAKRKFRFTSNKLDYLAQILDIGQKVDTGGFELWKDIIEKQDRKAFDKMVAYCEHDVELLEDVYLALRPYDDKHPSVVVMGQLDKPRCNVCGSDKIHKNGSYSTLTQTYQKYKCGSCGHNLRSRQADKKTKEQKHNLLRSL